MEPVVIGRSDLGEAYGAAPSGVGTGLLDPAGAIPHEAGYFWVAGSR